MESVRSGVDDNSLEEGGGARRGEVQGGGRGGVIKRKNENMYVHVYVHVFKNVEGCRDGSAKTHRQYTYMYMYMYMYIWV